MAVIEINWRPSHRDLRVFAIVQLVAATICAWLLHRRSGWTALPIGLMIVSSVILAWGMVQPQILRPLLIGWMLAAFPIGWVMSHFAMAIVYYGIITPIGLMLRWRGRDALRLNPDQNMSTYWIPRPEPSKPSRYFRQF